MRVCLQLIACWFIVAYIPLAEIGLKWKPASQVLVATCASPKSVSCTTSLKVSLDIMQRNTIKSKGFVIFLPILTDLPGSSR